MTVRSGTDVVRSCNLSMIWPVGRSLVNEVMALVYPIPAERNRRCRSRVVG
jgi:hypothetical protein